MIVWESKQTKAWSDSWPEKLKRDQMSAKAEVGVVVSTALPKGVSRFGLYEGIWVADFLSALGLASALRSQLIAIARERRSSDGKAEKMEMLYTYLSGPEFRQKVEAMIDAFRIMKSDLDSEKQAMQRIWSKREKQIDRFVTNLISFHGDLEGIAGTPLPQIKSTELKALALGGGSEDEDGKAPDEEIPF